jgi:hypothetical protein
MNEIWIAQQDEDIKLRLAQLEGHAESAINESIEHKDVALASSYITALMAAVAGQASTLPRNGVLDKI